MTLQTRDPERWEHGCRHDFVRNNVIIPDLLARLARVRPNQIADVGSGTGYISRVAAGRYFDKHARWVLLENDPQMLGLAAKLIAGEQHICLVEYNIFGTDKSWLAKFDVGFCCFSSLDFGMNPSVAERLVGLIGIGGRFIIYLPDLLEDVAQMCSSEGSLDPLHAYRRGAAAVHKPDRFTGRPEPFAAHRIEHCISDMLAAGASMRELKFLDRTADRRIVAMEFTRTT